MNDTLIRIRLGKPFLGFFEGSELSNRPDALDVHGYGNAGRELALAIDAAPTTADGSVTVTLSRRAAEILADFASLSVMGAAENVGGGRDGFDKWAVAELNSSRAILRNLAKADVHPL